MNAEDSVAIDYFRRALAVQRAVGDEFSAGITLMNICDCELVLGQVAEAEATALEAVAANRRTGHWLGEAESLLRLGDAAHRVGRTVEAAEHWRTAAGIFERIGHDDVSEARARLAKIEPAAGSPRRLTC